MTKYYIIIINYLFYIIFIFIILLFILNLNNHPIIIIIIILIYTLIICLNISLWKFNFILSILLFLIIIRGLLIIFLYFSRLISNAEFKLKLNLIIILPIIANSSILFYFLKSYSLNSFIYKYNFHESNPIFQTNKITFNFILNLYEYPLRNWTTLSIFYLLSALFIIIKICSSKSLSLRKIN